ncbi:MAG: hypothetical protein JW902_01205, partial [Syntrophaceae bacterium]|nr:hypothetical protein [Syntrophaceae bacterium]
PGQLCPLPGSGRVYQVPGGVLFGIEGAGRHSVNRDDDIEAPDRGPGCRVQNGAFMEMSTEN